MMSLRVLAARERLLDAGRKYADLTDGPANWPHIPEMSVLEAGARLRLAAKELKRIEKEEGL